jgi:hypothetical protein
MQRGHLSSGWFVTCGVVGCKNCESVEGGSQTFENLLHKRGWVKSAALGWICPTCKAQNAQYILSK